MKFQFLSFLVILHVIDYRRLYFTFCHFESILVCAEKNGTRCTSHHAKLLIHLDRALTLRIVFSTKMVQSSSDIS